MGKTRSADAAADKSRLSRSMTMWTKTITQVGLSAAVTLAVAIGLGSPAPLNALSVAEAPAEAIAHPALTVNGCTVEAQWASQSLKPGDTPQLALILTNPTEKAVDLDFDVDCMVQPPASPWARMVIMPRSSWHKHISMQLAPGVTMQLPLKAKISTADEAPQAAPNAEAQQAPQTATNPLAAPMQHGSSVYFTLRSGDKQVGTQTMSVIDPNAKAKPEQPNS
jgi:hypothetical protein